MKPLSTLVPFAFLLVPTFVGAPAAPRAVGDDALLPGLLPGAVCVLPVRDVATSKLWYAKLFGSQEVMAMPDGSFAEMTTPTKDLCFGLSREEAPDVRGERKLVFTVGDVVKAKAALEAAKVRIVGDVRTIPGVVKLLEFTDPDGNPLMLAESLAPSPASRPAKDAAGRR